MSLTVISDVHGLRGHYLKLCEKANTSGSATVQIGDLGYLYDYVRLMSNSRLDINENKFFMGNHDSYDVGLINQPGGIYYNKSSEFDHDKFNSFCLGNYGKRTLGGIDFYFVRGAFSIDLDYRRKNIDYFPDEEISYIHHGDIIADYYKNKPDIMLTHDCPLKVGHNGLKNEIMLKRFGFDPYTFTTLTASLLQQLFDIHKPKLWIFGHYHQNWTETIKGTKFICMEELGTYMIK